MLDKKIFYRGCPLKIFSWLPNALSIIRIVLSPLIVILAYQQRWTLAFVILLALMLTDFFDGLAAIKLKAISKLGAILDEVGDSVLSASAVLGLFVSGMISISAILFLLLIWIVLTAWAIWFSKPQIVKRICTVLLPFYYLSVVFTLVAWYAKKAFGIKAICLLPIALLALIVAGYVKRHRLLTFFRAGK